MKKDRFGRYLPSMTVTAMPAYPAVPNPRSKTDTRKSQLDDAQKERPSVQARTFS